MRMLCRGQCRILEFPRGNSCLSARTSSRAPEGIVVAVSVMTTRVRGLVDNERSTLRDATLLDELLTREVHCKLVHVHARLNTRRSRSRRANRRILRPVITCGRPTVVDVGSMGLGQPRCARRIFHVYVVFFLHTRTQADRGHFTGLFLRTDGAAGVPARGAASTSCEAADCSYAWVRVLNVAPEVL